MVRYCIPLLVVSLLAQEIGLRSTSKLVVAPVSITDKQGKPVRGLTSSDLVVLDNNVPAKIQIEEVIAPISLAIVVEASTISQPALDKLRKEASMFGPVILGEKGEAAVIAFANEVRTVQSFTSDTAKIERAIANLDSFGDGGSILDAVSTGLEMLNQRKETRRRVLVLISEKHDRSSKAKLEDIVTQAQRVNATIYAASFSPTKTTFVSRAPKYCDPPDGKCRRCDCKNCGNHCDREHPESVPDTRRGGMNLLALFTEMKRLAQKDVAESLAASSGGQAVDFVRRQAIEEALQRIGDDLHDQYIVTFPASPIDPDTYHRISVQVRDRTGLTIRHRPGYLN